MQDKKNDLMLRLAAAAAILNAAIFGLTRWLKPFQNHGGMHGSEYEMTPVILWAQNILLFVPFVLLGYGTYRFFKDREHPGLPWINTLTLTFSSISIISGSGGGVEFHFSIFMVLAIAAYYENIRLIAMMTIVFAVQHIAGFFFMPELVFGTDDYPFLMLVVHAVFLILTSCATTLQIISKGKITAQLEAEKTNKEERMLDMVQQIEKLSGHIRSTSAAVKTKSLTNIKINQTMQSSFDEVSGGLGDQIMSIEQMDSNLGRINRSIQAAFESSEEMKAGAVETEQVAASSHQAVHAIQEQNKNVMEAVMNIVESMRNLQQATSKAEGMVSMIQEVADQTNLLALNASIEAARAGEHGKGFAIVASEIRKLSDQSRSAAEVIRTIMSNVRQVSEANMDQVERGKEAILQSATNIDSFAADFEQVRQMIRHMFEYILAMNRMMTEIFSEAKGVTGEMNHISAIIEEGLTAMEELRDMSGTQFEAAEQVDEELEKLSELSRSLEKQLIRRIDGKQGDREKGWNMYMGPMMRF